MLVVTIEQSLLSWHLHILQLAKQSFLMYGNSRHKSGVTAEQSLLSLQIADVIVSKHNKNNYTLNVAIEYESIFRYCIYNHEF